MPLVRIDLVRGRTEEAIQQVADAIHNAIVETYAIPVRDRFQIITEHEPARIIAQDAGLGFQRSNEVVMIQIFTQKGRPTETKQRLYRAITEALGRCGVEGNDVFIGYVENTAADWSFGFGRAPYIEGDLSPPKPI